MRKYWVLKLAVIAFLTLPLPVVAGDKSPELSCGVAYSVDEGGSLLLQHQGKFSLIDVGAKATIQNGNGQAVALGDIHRGDWIEYRVENGSRTFYVNLPQRADCSKPMVLGQSR
jgi:hypothetical protein